VSPMATITPGKLDKPSRNAGERGKIRLPVDAVYHTLPPVHFDIRGYHKREITANPNYDGRLH